MKSLAITCRVRPRTSLLASPSSSISALHTKRNSNTTVLLRRFSDATSLVSNNKNIERTAIIDLRACIHEGVRVGHYCIVGSDVTLQKGVNIEHHAIVQGETDIGEATHVYPFASIGGGPQSKRTVATSSLSIGKRCIIRENVTINSGTTQPTIVGDDVWLLASAHIGHDAFIGNHVVISNAAQIAGHVRISDFCVLGGLAAVQQFCVVGRGAMIGGGAIVDQHVPPYALVVGNRAKFHGINIRGLRRRGIPNSHVFPLLRTAKKVYGSSHIFECAQSELQMLLTSQKHEYSLAVEFLEFIVQVGTVREDDGWCARRAKLGIVQGR